VISVLLNLDLTRPIVLTFVTINSLILIVITFLIYVQPENKDIKTFKLPFSPFLQMIAVFVNVFLITTLSVDTYIRFGIWFGIGLLVYMSYGVRKSGEHVNNEDQCWFLPCIEMRSKSKRVIRDVCDDDDGDAGIGRGKESLTKYGADVTSING